MAEAQLDRRPAPVLTGPAPSFGEILALHGKWRRDRPALITDDAHFGWAEFDSATARLANGLLDAGAAGRTIIVAMQNSAAMAVTLMGAARAGVCTAPLNLTITDEAMLNMIADCQAAAVFASPDQAERLDRAGLSADIARYCAGPTPPAGWTALGDWFARQSDAPPEVEIVPDAPFNIIYSSGTTGTPKGILHTFQTRLDWARDLSLALRYHSGAAALCTLGLYSNIAWVMMLCTWLNGGTVRLTSGFDAGDALRIVEEARITHTAMVPVQFQRLLDHPDCGATDLSSMQAMMSCGSPLSPALKGAIFDRFACGVIELYGLTEGVITTLAPEDAEGRLASVGKPLVGSDIKIIGEEGREQPPGAAGEIVARGRIVMPGYLNRPAATQEALWRDEKGRAWIRTGDIGRLDRENFLYIVDRKKDMILSGGQNIYPADIEAVLLEHPDVRAAAVIGLPHADWGETPVAILEAREGAELDAEAVKAWLNARVGKRQRISAAHRVDALPRNANGKVLKRELRDRFKSGWSARRSTTPFPRRIPFCGEPV